MSDITDDASDLEEKARISAYNKMKANQEKPPFSFNGKDCYMCKDELEEVRKENGKFRCIGCQIEFEKRTKTFRG